MSEKTLRMAPIHAQSLLQRLDDADRKILIAESHRRVFDPGAVIFYQGDMGATCQVILEGRVRVYVAGEDGRELSLNILEAGEIIGEMALFEEMPRSANVEALTETQTLEFDRNALLRCLRRSPTLALEMLRALCTRVRNTTVDAERLASLPVPERLFCRLEQLASRSGHRVVDGVCITPPMTQQELADLVWTSRESINRALNRLQSEGRLRLDNGWIVVLDGVVCQN
ncbi:MAG: Crp/Fnr family transcriptional regulator [Anaerolineae bacterium]|nr:Crp/Fnr family transcriptional regulator [Anaerolineae bacterium]